MTENKNPADEYHLSKPEDPPDILHELAMVDVRLFGAALAARNFVMDRMNQELAGIKDLIERAQGEIIRLRAENERLRRMQ